MYDKIHYNKKKKNPAMQVTQFLSLACKDPPEEAMVTHSSILAWRIPRTEEPGGLQSLGSQKNQQQQQQLIKHSQGTLAPSQGLQTVFWAITCELSTCPPGGRS